MKTVVVSTSLPIELVDITAQVQDIVTEAGVVDGICSVFLRHTTASLLINENEPGLLEDIVAVVGELFPQRAYHHDRVDNNARAHLVAALMGGSLAIPIADGKLVLGTWQSIFFLELDGPRPRRTVAVAVLPCPP